MGKRFRKWEARSCEYALKGSLEALHQAAEHCGENALSTVATAYLSRTHRDQPGKGCALAALGAEAARHDSPVRGAFTQNVRSVVEILTRMLPRDSNREKRERALATYASMVGAIVLARAVDDADLFEDVLKSVLASIAQPVLPLKTLGNVSNRPKGSKG